MTVYVDDWRQRARVGHLDAHWSHLIIGPGDDIEELHAFAAGIGLRRTWFQDKPWPHAHYDVTESKRRQAIAAGATAITWRKPASRPCAHGNGSRPARQARPEVMSASWSPGRAAGPTRRPSAPR